VAGNGDPVAGQPRAPGIPGENFVFVAGGAATIGRNVEDISSSHPDCKIGDDEAPAHRVDLAPYYLSKYEVTNREYRDFVNAAGHGAPKGWKSGSYLEGTDEYPITGVSWHDAVAYCEWRSRRDGVAFRLPTEHEWEWAARGDDDRLWPWNSIWNSSYANGARKATEGSVMPVNKPPNSTDDRSPRGVFAMAGNVAEWTASRPEPYPGSRFRRPAGIETLRVVRGGSFNTSPNDMRTTYRTWYAETKLDDQIGFRLAATPPSGAP
jgi:serine/threonine-protein kinase